MQRRSLLLGESRPSARLGIAAALFVVPTVRSRDPGDDYLIALAADQRIPLVSGDRHLLDLADGLSILTPTGFLKLLAGD